MINDKKREDYEFRKQNENREFRSDEKDGGEEVVYGCGDDWRGMGNAVQRKEYDVPGAGFGG